MAKKKKLTWENRPEAYQSLGNGVILGCDDAIKGLAKSKVELYRQICALSASVISETFGVVGKPYIDGLRFAMIEDVQAWRGPQCSWRESAARVAGAAHHGMLH